MGVASRGKQGSLAGACQRPRCPVEALMGVALRGKDHFKLHHLSRLSRAANRLNLGPACFWPQSGCGPARARCGDGRRSGAGPGLHGPGLLATPGPMFAPGSREVTATIAEGAAAPAVRVGGERLNSTSSKRECVLSR